MEQIHIPVLLNEIRALLNLKKGDTAIDCTLDGGGHAEMILQEVGIDGRVLGIEQDPEMVKFISSRIEKEDGVWNALDVCHGNFRDITQIAEKNNLNHVNGVLMDLGMSKWHFTQSGRGFSFQNPDEPLSMALEDTSDTKRAAAELLNYASQEELANIFFHYGEDRRARKIAEAVVSRRKKKYFYTVGDLLETVEPILGHGIRGRNPATKIFQALRVAVNDELSAITEGLAGAWEILDTNGRIAVISYHSLEDRIVKLFFKDCVAKKSGHLINKKPIEASREEVLNNPSARSAKLRVIEKI